MGEIGQAVPPRPRRSIGRRLLAALVVLGWIATLAVVVRAEPPSTVTAGQRQDAGPCERCLPASRELWPQVAFIGDSWTSGSDMGGRGRRNYSAVLGAAKTWRVDVVSAVGGTGYVEGGQWLPRPLHFGAPDRVAALHSKLDLVFIVNGVNDWKQPMDRIEPAAYDTYRAVTSAAPRARVVVVGYIPVGQEDSEVEARNDALANAAARADVTFWDPVGQSWFTGRNARHLGVDGNHLTDEGHEVFARLLAARATAAGLDEIVHPEPPMPVSVVGT